MSLEINQSGGGEASRRRGAFGALGFGERRKRVLELESRAVDDQRPGHGPTDDPKDEDPLGTLQQIVGDRVRMLIADLPLDQAYGFDAALARRHATSSRSLPEMRQGFVASAMERGAALDEGWLRPVLSDTVTPVSLVSDSEQPGTPSDGPTPAVGTPAVGPVRLSPGVLHREMDPSESAKVWAGLLSGVHRQTAVRRRWRWTVSAAAAVLLGTLGFFTFGGTSSEPEFVYRDVAEPPQGSWLAVTPVRAFATPGPR